MTTDPRLEGFESLSRALEELKMGQGSQAINFATRKAAVPILEKARQNAPVGERPLHKIYTGQTVSSGYGKRNIIMRMGSDKAKTRRTALIGPTAKAYYMSQFVELGKNIKHKMRAQPWLRPAIRGQQTSSVYILKTELKKKIDRIAKANAKAKK